MSVCSRCGTQNPPDAGGCHRCGYSLAATDPDPTTAPANAKPNPERTVPLARPALSESKPAFKLGQTIALSRPGETIGLTKLGDTVPLPPAAEPKAAEPEAKEPLSPAHSTDAPA